MSAELTGASQIGRLLARVSRRLYLRRLGARFPTMLLVMIAVFGALLLTARLSALIPDRFGLTGVALLPAAALLLALASCRRPTPVQSARYIDRQVATDDLFLTALRIGSCVGAYRPLVLAAAEARAPAVDWRQVVPLRWQQAAVRSVAALLLLAAAVLLLPSFDPWGKAESRQQVATLAQELQEQRQAARQRIRQLEQQQVTTAASPEVKRALEKVIGTLSSLRPQQRDENTAKLREQQRLIGDLWRKTGEQEAQGKRTPGGSFLRQQQLGSRLSEQAWEWQRQLHRGSSAGVQEEIDQLKELARRLAAAKDPTRQQRLQQELQQRLQRLARLLEQELSRGRASQAARRARQDLALSNFDGLSGQALSSLQQSLELAGLELEAELQALRDLQALEEALHALQMARQLNDEGRLRSRPSERARDRALSSYSELYKNMLAEGTCQRCGSRECPGARGGTCRGRGGTGGEGRGTGGEAPEDDSVRTAFTTEQSRSTLAAGSVLLQWQTRGVAAPGPALQAYRQAVRDVRQGASEAVRAEQVPPGYHGAIQRYFDTIATRADADAEPHR